jgi:hypothetical protein
MFGGVKMIKQTNEKQVSNEVYIELSRLMIEIAYRIDNLKASTLYELCTEDAELYIGFDPIIGCEAIKEWGEKFDKADQLHGIRHMCGNFRFTEDSKYTVKGISLLTAFYSEKSQSQSTVPFAFGEDQDTFVKTKDGWKLKKRLWVPLLMRE